MGDENPIRPLGDYPKSSHEGYKNSIELPVGNNVVPLRSDTIRLVQNGCSFHSLWFEDPNQYLKDFFKLVDSLDLDCEIDRDADGKLHNKNADESWEIIENLALYDHEGWNDSKDFVKPVKAISTPQSTSKTPDRRLLELEDQINFLLKGPRPTPRPSSTHVPYAYAEAVYSNPHPRNLIEPPKQDPFTFHPPNEKEVGESGPDWVIRSKFKDELAGFMLEKKLHTKGLGEMLDQHRGIHEQFSQILSEIGSNETLEPDTPNFAITTKSKTSTRDPPYPTPPESMTIDHAEINSRKRRARGEEQATCRMGKAPSQPPSTTPLNYPVRKGPKGPSHKEKLEIGSLFVQTKLKSVFAVIPEKFCLKEGIHGIMQMMYCVVNNIHVDYAELLWEGIYYSFHHTTSSIPYPRFTKIIVSHYMTIFPKISRRARDMYHNLQDDDIMKNIFNSGRHKDKVGMQIPDWMITEEMKHTEHYRMYAEVFGLDVPLTQSQPTESTQGTHRTPSAPRSPTHKKDTAELSALKRSTMIRFRLPERRSTHLTPPVPVPTVEKADEMILQDTLQVSLAEHKSREEQEARENVELVNKHLASEKIEKLVEGSENVIDDSSPPRNDEPQIPDTRLEPRSDKESPEVERTNDEVVEVTNVVIPVNVNEEGDEITDEVYKLKRMEKWKIVEESRSIPLPILIRSPRTHTNLVSSDIEKLQELTETHTQTTPSSRSQHTKLSRETDFYHCSKLNLLGLNDTRISFRSYRDEGLIMERQKTKEEMERMIAKAILQERGNIQAKISSQIQKAIDHHIPSQVDASVRSYMSGHILHVPQTTCRPFAVRPRDQDDPHDDAHPEGENSAKRQKTFECEAYVSGESSSGQVNEEERGPSTSGNQEQEDDYDFWTNSYASDDDEILTKQVSQDIIKEMKNFLQSDIVWESRKEIRVSSHPRKTTPPVQSCQRDPEAPALSLINQDLLYLKKGSSGTEKIVLSLHKFPTIIFNNDDIEERTSRWVNKCVKKFNPYARYGVEHWKNPYAKIFYIQKQKEPRKLKEEPDYKNLNKNDIEDMYLLIMNGNVPDYAETGLLWSLSVFIRSSVIWERVHDFQLGIESYQQKVNLTTPTMSFPGVEKHIMFSIIYEPVHRIIYKNSKKEKRVMRHSEIHKFCDATLNRVLEGLKSYNNDVKYGYVQRELTNDEVEYLKLFEEEIEVRLKHHNQMRRWEMYVNGRPLGPRRERPE
ncbi:hypothetical protein Tco_0564984 [Tanacetum coccineum]